jgi:hypothetical protein
VHRLDGRRYHGICTKFHKVWFRHSEFYREDTQHTESNVTSWIYFYIYESRRKNGCNDRIRYIFVAHSIEGTCWFVSQLLKIRVIVLKL